MTFTLGEKTQEHFTLPVMETPFNGAPDCAVERALLHDLWYHLDSPFERGAYTSKQSFCSLLHRAVQLNALVQ